MKKIYHFVKNNLLYLCTLFLLIFIPLYPKLPLFDIRNTWVYIRLEDFIIVAIMIAWFILFLRNKISFKTPLTLSIMIFWIIGGISTLHGVLILFPTLSNVFSNVAILSYLRRIEYMSLFFLGFSAIKDKRFLPYIPIVLSVVIFLVVLYGFGQKLLGLPAFLTGNEEFAKGIPLRISALGRVPSTFAGHYDLAAYLVLTIPILVSAFFGFKNILLKAFFLLSASLGFILMFMTVSRISFIVLLLSLFMLLIFQKKKIAIISLLLGISLFVMASPSLLTRFQSTVSNVDVLVNTETRASIGHVKEVPKSYFKNKLVLIRPISEEDKKDSSSSAIFPYRDIPHKAELILESTNPNGENLPQGSSYINLSLSPVVKTTHLYFFEKTVEENSTKSGEVQAIFGDFVIKNPKAYDISFTTRLQGEWPNTLAAFKRNIFLGSGYGSVSLAVDNNYLRILGELGLIGFLSFMLIFIISAVCIKKLLPRVDSKSTRSFILGFVAGSFGLALNALFIDVFEASKIAFTYWLLLGTIIGGLMIYKDINIDYKKEIKNILSSSYALIIYFSISVFILFSGIIGYYFVGDDFTWLRWATDCNNCAFPTTISQYFTQADGFFYRPGTKVYFYLMQNIFWLNQVMYHFVSILLHLINIIMLFLISRKILKSYYLSAITAFIFIIISGYSEIVLWISATGHLFNITFILIGLLSYILWRENKKIYYFIISFVSIILSLLFHELGIIAPVLIIAYDIVFYGKIELKSFINKIYYYILLIPIIPYLFLRILAKSHWLSGDYDYNLLKLPFNIVGNLMGYLMLTLFGSISLNFYETSRILMREHYLVAFLGMIILIFVLFCIYKLIFIKLKNDEKRVVVFAILFFIISLIPFLGLGNISSRYSYLAAFGICILIALSLKKIYELLIGKDKYITISLFTLTIVFFLSIQLSQLQKTQTDWREAGEKSQSFLESLEHAFVHYGVADTSRLYFINVPIKSGEAWVFPVGLKDAIWLLFPNKNLIVNQASSVDEALGIIGASNGRVFEFNEDGSLVEWTEK